MKFSSIKISDDYFTYFILNILIKFYKHNLHIIEIISTKFDKINNSLSLRTKTPLDKIRSKDNREETNSILSSILTLINF